MTEDEMVGWWHHQLNGHEFDHTLEMSVCRGCNVEGKFSDKSCSLSLAISQDVHFLT